MSSDWSFRRVPIAIALTVAVVSVGTLTLLVRDRWHPPEIKSAADARRSETGAAARAVGAMVLPTDPTLSVEPQPSGPKRAQPANPY